MERKKNGDEQQQETTRNIHIQPISRKHATNNEVLIFFDFRVKMKQKDQFIYVSLVDRN